MAFFSATQEEIARGKEIRLAILVDFDFVEGHRRVWHGGFGTLVAGGHSWTGLGETTSIDAISFGENDAADSFSFGLSGVDSDFLALAEDSASVAGRDVAIYGQFLDENCQPLDDMWVIRSLICARPGYGASGPTSRSASLAAETIWTNRSRAPNALYSDRDQKARFSGDEGLSFISALKYKRVAWPAYS